MSARRVSVGEVREPSGAPRGRGTWAARLAWSLCALTVVQVALGAALAALGGMSLYRLVTTLFVAAAVAALAFTAVGALIVRRQPGHAVGWLFCAAGLGNGLFAWVYRYAWYALETRAGTLPFAAGLVWTTSWVWVPVEATVVLFLPLLFPDGRLPSRRWRPLAWLAGVALVAFTASLALGPIEDAALPDVENPLVLVGTAETLRRLIERLSLVLMLGSLLGAIAATVARFRRARGIERQQLKWFAYAAALLVAAYVVSVATFLSGLVPSGLVGGVLLPLAFLCVPTAVGIAILRYHLYDIDLIIRRTLVYGALTATLALLYAGGVAGLQGLIRALTGRAGQSQLAVVASTLAIAALFQPLRRRLQAAIDRRFYRRRYDAQRTLGAFGATLRDETDLERLRAHVLGVVQETMQPAHAALWLRQPERDR